VNKEAFIQNREQNPMMSGKQNQVLVNFKWIKLSIWLSSIV
jgi:hypothetical protein